MKTKITLKDLKVQAEFLNEITGSPKEPDTGSPEWETNEGHYYISGSYGGHCLARKGGTFPLGQNHVPKREAHGLIRAYIAGIHEGKNA